MSRSYFYGSEGVRTIEVLLYFLNFLLKRMLWPLCPLSERLCKTVLLSLNQNDEMLYSIIWLQSATEPLKMAFFEKQVRPMHLHALSLLLIESWAVIYRSFLTIVAMNDQHRQYFFLYSNELPWRQLSALMEIRTIFQVRAFYHFNNIFL